MKIRSLFLQPYLQVALLLLAVITLYAGALSAPFVFDDIDFFSNSEMLSKYGRGYFSFELRWLPYASLVQTTNWLGFDPSWLRLGNVLLHAANAIALFFLLRRLFRVTLAGDEANALTPSMPPRKLYPLSAEGSLRSSGEPAGVPLAGAGGGQSAPPALTWFAFFGALIFALHPVAVYGVAYLIQRSTLMATLFVLLMLLAYLEGLLRGSWRWMLVAALCYFAAVYSKEHSIAAPGVALALTLLVRKPSAALFRQIAPYYAIATLIAVAVVWSTVSSKEVLGVAYEPNAGGMLEQGAKLQGLTDLPNLHLLSIFTQCWLFFKYLWLWLLPNPAWMSVDMREPFAMSLFGWPDTLGLIGFLGYFCGAVWLLLKRGRRGLLGFALLFPWIMFLTEWSTVRIQEPFVLYRSYLWMPGMFAALPLVFGWLAPKKTCPELSRRGFIVLGLVSVLLVPLTLNRLDTFSSAIKLWDDAEKLVRGKSGVFGIERVYYNRGTELGQLKRYDEAIADFSKAIAIYPFDFLYGNRATAYYFLGKYQDALRDYDRAIALNPDNASSYYGRALTYRALGDIAAEQEDLRKSCALGLCP